MTQNLVIIGAGMASGRMLETRWILPPAPTASPCSTPNRAAITTG